MIKSLRIIFLIICLFINSTALCKGIDSDQQKINSAIEVIQSYGFEKNIAILQGSNYKKQAVNIIFKDLSDVQLEFSKCFAITATDDNGDLYILINNNLRNSDVRALACLILHESNHCKENIPDSVAEEVTAHEHETILYLRLLEDDDTLKYKTDDRLIVRLNKLKKLYDDAVTAYLSSNTIYINHLKIKE